ncbi:hypothetical protein RQP46_007290 [Phenoliferia psychrophenolica]
MAAMGTVTDTHALKRGNSLSHSSMTPTPPGRLEIGSVTIRRDPATGQAGFDLPVGGDLAWSMYQARLKRTPPLGASDIYGGGRAWLLNTYPTKITPTMLPFARAGKLSIEARRLEEGAPTYPISRIAHLDDKAGNAFELQLLVVLTLFQQDAPKELLELNLSRLEEMAGSDAGARGVWADVVAMVLPESAETKEKASDDQ